MRWACSENETNICLGNKLELSLKREVYLIRMLCYTGLVYLDEIHILVQITKPILVFVYQESVKNGLGCSPVQTN